MLPCKLRNVSFRVGFECGESGQDVLGFVAIGLIDYNRTLI